MYYFSPLEQFDFINMWNFIILNEYFKINFDIVNIYIYLISILFFFFYILIVLIYKLFHKSFISNLFEKLYLFLIKLLYQQTGKLGIKFYPFFFVIFFVILLSNLLGMLPFSFTLTAHISLTFFLAFSFNLGLIIFGFYKNGIKFLLLFLPKGTPIYLLPLIIIIEFVSYLIRTFSLSIRLFANMLAGHCLMFVISMFVFSILNNYVLVTFSLNSICIVLIIVSIYILLFILEFAIAFLQAYVFVILLMIYLNDSLHPSH